MEKTFVVKASTLIKRINRRLKKEWQGLRSCKYNSRGCSELGDYYIVDHRYNTLVAQWVDPEELGRELGALRSWETVVY